MKTGQPYVPVTGDDEAGIAPGLEKIASQDMDFGCVVERKISQCHIDIISAE